MKTLRKISDRKLDRLQDRLSNLWWNEADCFPRKTRPHVMIRINKMLVRIGQERFRRMQRILP